MKPDGSERFVVGRVRDGALAPVGGSLDEAWAEAEAALPEGWEILALLSHGPLYPDERRWEAQTAHRASERTAARGFGLTPAAALRALTAKLHEP